MIALTRTHSKTALLCFAFLLAGAGCEQKPETPQQSDGETATDAATDIAHEDHDAHADHDEHAHDEHAGHEEHDHEGHEDHHHDAADMTTYACHPEQEIKAHYDPANSTQPATSAHLLINGVEYDLTAMTVPKNNAGAAYETDIGIANEAGMRWQVSADATKAVLSNKTLDGSVTESEETVLFDCQKVDS